VPDEFWDEPFGLRLGPWGFWAGPYRPFGVRYSRTEASHILRIRIRPTVKKEEVKVRMVEPGVLEVEWPRRRGEEIPIE